MAEFETLASTQEDTRLFYELKDISLGIPEKERIGAARWAIDTVLEEPQIKFFIIEGPPGIGKTVLAELGAIALIEESGGKIIPVHMWYEDAEAKAIARYGPLERWDHKQGSAPWVMVNDSLIETHQRIADLPSDNDQRIVCIVENVGVGSKEERDRGVTYSEWAAQRALEEDDSLRLRGIYDPYCQKITNEVRTQIHHQQNYEVAAFLRENFNIKVIVRGLTQAVPADGRGRRRFYAQVGSLVKKKLGTTARQRHIKKIEMEMEGKADSLYLSLDDSKKEIVRAIQRPASLVRLPAVERAFHEDEFGKIVYEQNQRLRTELRIPPERGRLALNEYDADAIIPLYIDVDEKMAA